MILKPGNRWGAITGKISWTPAQALKETGFVMHPDALGVIFRTYTYLDNNNQPHKGTFISNYFPPSNPQTPAQQHRRGIFAGAVARWQALHPGQREEWNKRARGHPLSGFNLFMRNAMKEA